MLQLTNTTSLVPKSGAFLPFLSLVILLLVFRSNFIVSSVKNLRKYPVLILNLILFSISFMYFFFNNF